jgi:hypothetical protein
MSQRMVGHEFAVELVGVDENGVVESISAPADLAISGTVTIATNVATINFAAPHGRKGGDRVILFGNDESRLNVGPVVCTIVTPLQITVPCTLANGTYNAGGSVRWADPCGLGQNVCGLLYENTTATNATFTARRNGSSARQLNSTVATTVALQTNTSPYCDAFNSANINELIANMQEFFYVSRASDGIAAPTGQNRWSQGIPDEEKQFKLRVRAKMLKGTTRPIAKVVSVSKSGSTTWTVVLDRDVSGILVAGQSQIAFSGNGDITNFPNTTSVVVATVATDTITFISTTGTSSNSYGGAVIFMQGSVTLAGLSGLSVVSLSRANNIMTITVNTTATGALPGEYWELYGCTAGSLGLYDGAYLIRKMTGSTYEVESVGADFATISNAGGMFFKRVEHRLHSIGEMEHTRHIVEMTNQNGSSDAARAMPVVPVSLPTLSAVTTLTTLTTGTNVMASFPVLVADIASAAIATATSSAITQAQGMSYKVAIGITAAASLVMDVGIEESDDVGVGWTRVYDFPRTSTSSAQVLRSPVLCSIGTRIRYVTTLISGTGTRVLNRFQMSQPALSYRQRFDRTVTLTTLSSVTATLEADDCDKAELVINVGAITTTAPVIQMQSSEDYGQSWFDIGTTLTAVASSTVSQRITVGVGRQLRAIVKTAGVGVTAGYVMLKAWR